MSVLSDDDLEHLARLLIAGGGRDFFPEIVSFLEMDDDTCRAPKLPQNKCLDAKARVQQFRPHPVGKRQFAHMPKVLFA
jgi:hypothetical protein